MALAKCAYLCHLVALFLHRIVSFDQQQVNWYSRYLQLQLLGQLLVGEYWILLEHFHINNPNRLQQARNKNQTNQITIERQILHDITLVFAPGYSPAASTADDIFGKQTISTPS